MQSLPVKGEGSNNNFQVLVKNDTSYKRYIQRSKNVENDSEDSWCLSSMPMKIQYNLQNLKA